jgi:HAMP domain-containing protein
MTKHSPSDRRKYRGLPVQLKYAMGLTLIACFTSLIMIFVMAWFIQRNYNLFTGDELGISAQVVEVVRNEQKLLETTLFILFLVSITVMFAAALYVTRKLTGPVVALQRHLWMFSRGDWSRDFRLRQNDEFRELETLVNQIRDGILKGKYPAARPQKME